MNLIIKQYGLVVVNIIVGMACSGLMIALIRVLEQ